MLHKKTIVREPFLEPRNPTADRSDIARTQAEAVPAAGVNVQFHWHAGPFEPEIDFGQSFRNIFAVVVSAREEGGWRIFRGLNVAGTARVDQRLKIGFGTLPFDEIAGVGIP